MDPEMTKAIGDLIESTIATAAEHPIGTLLFFLFVIWIVKALRSESREAKATRRRVEEETKILKAREKIEAARARTPGTPEYRSVFREALDRGPKPDAAEKRLHDTMEAVVASIERLRRDTLTQRIRENQQRRVDVTKTRFMIIAPINSAAPIMAANTRFDSRDEATEEAQRQTKNNPVEIWQLVAVTKVPVPHVVVESIVEDTEEDETSDEN